MGAMYSGLQVSFRTKKKKFYIGRSFLLLYQANPEPFSSVRSVKEEGFSDRLPHIVAFSSYGTFRMSYANIVRIRAVALSFSSCDFCRLCDHSLVFLLLLTALAIASIFLLRGELNFMNNG